MDSEPSDTGMTPRADVLPGGQFSGRLAFQALVRDALRHAAQEGWPEIIFSDASYLDWPLRERSVMDSLQAWASSGRSLTVLAVRYDELVRHHARFVTWRKTWSHIVDCRVCQAPAAADFPSAIWTPTWFMYQVDPLRHVGASGCDPARRVNLREELAQKIRASTPGFPASVLGL